MIDRDDLLRRTDLAVLLDELSPRPPTRLGQNARWRCINPGHDDHHPSITMFTDRRGIQRWKCWSGGHGGTAIDALLVARGGTIADALAELERRAGLPHEPGQQRPSTTARRLPPTARPRLTLRSWTMSERASESCGVPPAARSSTTSSPGADSHPTCSKQTTSEPIPAHRR